MVKKSKSKKGNFHDTVRLEKYVDKLNSDLKLEIERLTNVIDDKLKAQKDVDVQSERVLNERLGRMNEFRDQINQERSNYVTKDVLDIRLKPMEARQNYISGRDATIVAVIAILLSVVMIVLRVLGH